MWVHTLPAGYYTSVYNKGINKTSPHFTRGLWGDESTHYKMGNNMILLWDISKMKIYSVACMDMEFWILSQRSLITFWLCTFESFVEDLKTTISRYQNVINKQHTPLHISTKSSQYEYHLHTNPIFLMSLSGLYRQILLYMKLITVDTFIIILFTGISNLGRYTEKMVWKTRQFTRFRCYTK